MRSLVLTLMRVGFMSGTFALAERHGLLICIWEDGTASTVEQGHEMLTALEHMRRQGGPVVTMAVVAATAPPPNSSLLSHAARMSKLVDLHLGVHEGSPLRFHSTRLMILGAALLAGASSRTQFVPTVREGCDEVCSRFPSLGDPREIESDIRGLRQHLRARGGAR